MWFVTHQSQRYELPDMLREHVTAAHEQLVSLDHSSTIIVLNASGAALMIPKRIIKKAGAGERCFWEAEE